MDPLKPDTIKAGGPDVPLNSLLQRSSKFNFMIDYYSIKFRLLCVPTRALSLFEKHNLWRHENERCHFIYIFQCIYNIIFVISNIYDKHDCLEEQSELFQILTE